MGGLTECGHSEFTCIHLAENRVRDAFRTTRARPGRGLGTDAVKSRFRPTFSLLATLLLSGCGLYWDQFGPEVRLYDGPERGAREVATIDQGAGCYTCVESIRRFEEKDPIYSVNPPGWEPVGSGLNRPNKIIVLAGKYLVTLRYTNAADSTGYVDLKPGHTYRVLNDTFSDSDKSVVWMEDAESGEVLLGGKM